MNKPIQKNKASQDFSKVVESVQEYVDFMDSEDYHEDEISNYRDQIFEKAVEAVYGETVWKFINEKMI